MTTHISSTVVRLAVASAVAAAIGTVGLMAGGEAATGQIGGAASRRVQQQAGVTYTRADADLIARRLYHAVLGRDADPTGLTVTIAEIQRGNLRSRVDTLLASTEFRTNQQSKSSAELLEQFYRGLLDRAPDTSGVRGFLPRVDRQQYADVVLDMIGSSEFKAILASPPPEQPAAAGRLERALECQTHVIDVVRRDAGGRIFLTFDRLPDVSADGQSLQGPAVDRFNDLDRQMTYRCTGQDVSYSYADRKAPAAADARLEFPSAAVRACQNAVRGGLIFDAAALSATDTNAEYVLGIAGGASHQCQMDGTRVVSVK
jgi:Domain of unknown function (DUF4214)